MATLIGSSRCPYSKDADYMCDVLVREILKSCCWKSKRDITAAIQEIRFAEKDLVAEWAHLNGQHIEESNTCE